MKEELIDNYKSELDFINEKLSQAENPEEIFGNLDGAPDKIKQLGLFFRQLSRVTHPDQYQNKEDQLKATNAFVKLNNLWENAREKLKKGTYGNFDFEVNTATENIVIKTRRKEYTISNLILQTDFSNIYKCTYQEDGTKFPAIFKATRNPLDNDFTLNEADILKHFTNCDNYKKFHNYFPKLIDSFSYVDKADLSPRQVNILSDLNEFYSLKEIKEIFPDGINPKDMAWMWRRLLVGIGFSHNNDVIHGSILPSHIFIQPEKCGLVLTEWSYGINEVSTTDNFIQAINSDYENWYPSEVKQKKHPTPSLDIYMGAKCMIYLLNGDPNTNVLPNSIDRRLQMFFRGCLLPTVSRRPQDAWSLLAEFDDLIKDLWGPRTFHPLLMPKKNFNNSFR